jgi:hypothetical protein
VSSTILISCKIKIKCMKEAINEYYLFNLSGGRKKIKVFLSDILLVSEVTGSHIDKLLYLKGNIIQCLTSIDIFTIECTFSNQKTTRTAYYIIHTSYN